MDTDDFLKEKFPEMSSVAKPPGMFTFNGIGTTVYGSRDMDQETQTYVKTLVFTIVFIPIFAIRAYRVAGAENGGWYFLGKVPLSGLAKAYNCLVAAALAVAISAAAVTSMITAYTTNPDYIAGQQMSQAAALIKEGDHAKGAMIYGEVAMAHSKHKEDARAELGGLVNSKLDALSLREAAVVLREASRGEAVAPESLAESGLALLEKKAGDQPDQATVLFDAVEALAPQSEPVAKQRRALLERLVTEHPKAPEFASQLAVDLEKSEECRGCEELLAPHADGLGATEGARILGQIFAARGDNENTYKLLKPYTDSHLVRLRRAQQDYERAVEAVEKDVSTQLQAGRAPNSFYRAYDAADERGQQKLVSEYYDKRLFADPRYKRALAGIEQNLHVVPVAMDLGIAMLNRAQSQPTEATRAAELEAAKDVFLSVRVMAANSPQYQLYLGQVHYWLGEHDQGKEQFDGLLAAAKREPQMLIQVAHSLREVGLNSEARALAEEAFGSAADDQTKSNAATLRAVTTVDLDERVQWYERGDHSSPYVQASLASARAEHALRSGNKKEAERQTREVIRIYGESDESMNNLALAHFMLYGLTSDEADLARGTQAMNRALALSPNNSVVVWNAASTYMAAGVRDVIGSSIDLERIDAGPSLEHMSFLYDDAAGRDRYAARLNEHSAIGESLKAMERARVLAPKASWIYARLKDAQWISGNLEGLESLRRKLDNVELDVEDAEQQARDFWAGVGDEKLINDLQTAANDLDEILSELNPRRHKVEFAIIATQRAQIELTRATMGLEADLEKAISWTTEAHKHSPSSATRQSRQNAHATRAMQTLSAKSPEFATRLRAHRRALGDLVLFSIALEDDTLRPTLLADQDARVVLQLIEDSHKRFPKRVSAWEWSVVRHADKQKAAQLQASLLEDRRSHLHTEIGRKLSPISQAWAYHHAWLEQARGNDAEARNILSEHAKLVAQGGK